MRKLLFLLLLPAFSYAWTKMYPLKECTEFYFEFQPTQTQEGTRYKIRFPFGYYDRQFEEMPYTLNSLDNLTQLTEEINKRAPQKCESFNSLNLDVASCLKSDETGSPLNPEFIQFSKNVLAFISTDIKTCEEFNELEVIGQDIERMSIQDIQSNDKSKRADIVVGRFLTWLMARDSVDEYNLFAKCGAKKFSSDFLRNVILLMARQECMFPPPEGYLHFDQALNIANEVGSKYEDTSILDINFKHYDKILKESYKKFAKTTVQQTIAETLGKKFDDPTVVEITDKSKNLKYLEKKLELTKKDVKVKDKSKRFNGKKKTTKEDHLSQYIGEVFATDITFELAPEILEVMLKESLDGSLPEDMNNDGKKDEKDAQLRKAHLKGFILPKVMAKYNKCIEPTKKYLAINDTPPNPDQLTSKNVKQKNIEDQVKVNKRLTLKCKNHPKYPLCLDKREAGQKRKDDRKNPKPLACGVSQGSFYQDKDKNEIHKIQACTYDAIFDVMPNILDLLITNTLVGIEKDQDLSFPPGLKDKLKEMGMETMKSCFNEKTKDKYSQSVFENNETNLDVLENMASSDYIGTLYSCAEKIEDQIAVEVFAGAINEMDIVRTSFKKIYPNLTEEQINEKARQIVKRGLDDCNDRMYDIIDGRRTDLKIERKDPLMCMPLVETLVAAQIVENYALEQIIELGSIKSVDDKHEAIEQFRKCKESAYTNSVEAIGNNQAKHPITNPKSAEEYLDNNGEFYQCVSLAIQGIVDDATGSKFEEMVTTRESIKDKKYALSLKEEVKEKSTACFKRKLNEIGTWGNLKTIFTKEEQPKQEVTPTGMRVQHELAPVSPDLEYSTQKEKEAKGGFDLLVEECEKEVEVYATSRIMQNEVINHLDPLVKETLLYQGTNGQYNKGDILALAIAEMRKEYGIELEPGLKGSEILTKSLEKILDKEIQQKGKADGALERFEELITKHTLEKVRDNFFAELDTATGISSSNFKKIKDAIDPICVKNLYENFTSDENASETTLKDGDIKRYKTMAIDYISKGLTFLEQLGSNEFDKKVSAIKELCKNSANIKSLANITNSDAFDFIVKQQIQEKFSQKLTEGIDSTLKDTIKKINPTLWTSIVRAIKSKHPEIKSEEEITGELLSKYFNSKSFDESSSIGNIQLRYAFEQYEESKKTIDKWINNPKNLNKLIFKDSEITDYAMKNIFDLIKDEDDPNYNKAIMDSLTSKILQKSFQDKSKGSFASDFTGAIILGGVGGEGVTTAVDSAVEQAKEKWFVGDIAASYAKKYTLDLYANKTASSNSVKKYLKWDQAPSSTREKMINSIFTNALEPSTKGEEVDIKKITEDITTYTQTKIAGKTYEDRVTDYVKPKTTDSTTQTVKAVIIKTTIPIAFPALGPLLW